MVARLIRGAGVDLGRDEDLTPSRPENQDGFWENVRFVEVNDAILSAAGGAWDAPPDISSLSSHGVARAKAELAILAFQHGRPWGWKDPRNSVTLPFWRALFPDLKLIVCLRNPLEVALSLSRRNLFSYESSLKLWSEYNERLLTSSEPHDRLVVHYDAFFSRAAREFDRIAQFTGVECETGAESVLLDSIKSELRHTRMTIENLSSAEVSRDVLELYLALCAEAEWVDTRLLEADAGSEEIATCIRSFRSVFRDHLPHSDALLNSAAFERDLYRERIERLERELDHMRAQRDWHAADRDKLASIIEQHAHGAEVQIATIRELKESMQELSEERRSLERQLQELESASNSSLRRQVGRVASRIKPGRRTE